MFWSGLLNQLMKLTKLWLPLNRSVVPASIQQDGRAGASTGGWAAATGGRVGGASPGRDCWAKAGGVKSTGNKRADRHFMGRFLSAAASVRERAGSGVRALHYLRT